MEWAYDDDWWKEVDEDVEYKMIPCASCGCENIACSLIECRKCHELVCEDCVNDEEVCADCLYEEEDVEYVD